MKNKKLEMSTIIISLLWLLVASTELSVFLGLKSIENFSNYITTFLFVFVAPVYFIFLSRYYRKNKLQKLSVKSAFKYIIIYLILEFIITLIMGFLTSFITAGSDNANLRDIDVNSFINYIIITFTLFWDLAGEEGGKLAFFFFLNIVLPLKLFKNNSKYKYWIIWFIDSIFFGILHLSAYSYDLAQCIFIIGLPTIIYGLIWKKTKNPKAMWLVHLLYDFIIVTIVFSDSFI